MSKPLDAIALFRLTVLGPLASRGEVKRGEIKPLVRQLATHTYQIPGTTRTRLSEPTILRWFYMYKKGGLEALAPLSRCDKGKSHLSKEVQTAVLQLKRDNPARSINTILNMLRKQGLMNNKSLARASIHRFLKQQKLSKRIVADVHTIERRSFVAEHCGDIWQGDVLHGPSIYTSEGVRKIYLVTFMDDASRAIMHSAFCLGETALDIEGVLKQAFLKRGLPRKLIFDNGSGYRSESLQDICAAFDIRVVYCPVREPEWKGKLERWHRTFREQFLNEIDLDKIKGLYDINARLWAWLEQTYHQQPHEGLEGKAPLERWREDLIHVRPLGLLSNKIDNLFCHRVKRFVRKDGTITWRGKRYEVSYELVKQTVHLVFDPHLTIAFYVESLEGKYLGPVTRLDLNANLHRKRQRPHSAQATPSRREAKNAVELAYDDYEQLCEIPLSIHPSDKKE